MNYFNPRHLKAFVATVESGSMANAADLLHLGQPALSQAIANLERRAGVRLLSRTTRTLKLTPAGHVFYKDAQRVLELNDRLLNNTKQWSAAQHGSVSILSIPSIAHLLLPDIIKTYLTQHPHVGIEVHDHPDPELRIKLEKGEGDLAILSQFPSQEKLKQLPFLKDHLRWVGAAHHPLAAKEKISLADLRNQQLIIMRRGAIREMSNPLIEKIKSPLAIIEVDQQSTLMGMVSAGIGISFLPSLSCQSAINNSTVHRALNPDTYFRIIQIARLAQHDWMPASVEFFKLFLNQLPKQKINNIDGLTFLKLSQPSIDHFLN